MKDIERTKLDLELILPYVNYLKEKINQFRRIERRKEIELCFPKEIGGHFQDLQENPTDEEIVLFQEKSIHEEVQVFREKAPNLGDISSSLVDKTEEERLEKVRSELEQIKYEASFDSDGNRL